MKMATFQISPLFTIVVPAIFMAAKNLALDFSVEKRQGEMLLPQGGISMTVPNHDR
jgi:hypothetical protein